ncbi:hypothetical protein TRSA_11190 [Treponema saccharophilum]|uniref:Uncharacterized protein n=1 Tax=Treponema saccharophilum DSM 2985 TaxID=907348 RepID=H7EMI1_9SPIR|nr:hypothetical protein TresaDRAFT_0403 [Treponema saccharophilum DSM 2985]BDC96020.1 hypothetical protein TRSA_11190 [Treponema saccharophilum]
MDSSKKFSLLFMHFAFIVYVLHLNFRWIHLVETDCRSTMARSEISKY